MQRFPVFVKPRWCVVQLFEPLPWKAWGLLLFLLFSMLPRVEAVRDPYEFTDRSGRKLEAVILQYNPTEVEVERVSDRRRFSLELNTLSDEDQRYLKEKYSSETGEESAKDQLTPGQVVVLEFPELGTMAGNKPAKCELSVPKHYDPSRPAPFFVWFSGGKGSHSVNRARGLVDFDRFLVLALPYPEGRLPRLAVEEGEDAIDAFWEFQQPMLERVIEMVPNISEDVRIAGGTSSGGHLVGSALDLKWRGFCNYFKGFVLHEGGTSPNMEFKGTRSSHHILVIYGENSIAREWQDYFIQRFDQTRGRITYVEVPEAGHGLNGAGMKRIRSWIDEIWPLEQ